MNANDASGVAKAAGNLGAVYLDSGQLALNVDIKEL